jgi:hypothetical protein
MYDFKAILDKEPVAIAAAIRSVLFVLVLTGLLLIDEKLLAGVALAAEVVLGLFVRNASTSTASPTLKAGTEVSIEGTEDKTTV